MSNLNKKSLLTLIEFVGRNKYNAKIGLYKCACGNIKKIREEDVKSLKTLSCGCFLKKRISDIFKKHGLSKHPLMRVWGTMKSRCYNKNTEGYKDYGGRGIKVCERWHDFINFYNDVISTYQEGLTLDRFPDVNGDYEPTNFRWANIEQQANNKRTNIFIEYKGEKMTLAQLFKRYSEVSYDLLHHRITKQKMPIEQALRKSNRCRK